MNHKILPHYVAALEEVLGDIETKAKSDGVENRYHIKDKSIARLIETLGEEINYFDELSGIECYWAMCGNQGLETPTQVREAISGLVEAAKRVIETRTN